MKKNVDKELSNLPLMDIRKVRRKVVSIRKSIEKDYNKELENIKKLRDKRFERLDEYGKNIEKYSTFVINEIGPVIADLFTLYNGEVYEYDYDVLRDNFIKHFIRNAINKRKSICINIIPYGLEPWNLITFYNYDVIHSEITEKDSLKYYPYLKKFIDFVITYRLNNNLTYIDAHHLEKCLHDFVVLYKEEIEVIQNNVKEEQKGEYGATLKLALAKSYLDRKAEQK